MIPAIIALASQKIHDHDAKAERAASRGAEGVIAKGFDALSDPGAVKVSTKREGNALHVAVCFVISLDGA